MDLKNIEYHPLANLFPIMQGDEYESLKADIKQNGLREPICMYNGMILDGRNRFNACMDLKIQPVFKTYTGTDPVAFVISMNIHRRHLNESQRAVVAGKLANMQQSPGTNQYTKEVNANLQRPQITQSEAAGMLNVSPRTVATIKAIERDAPELIEKIQSGEMSAHEATKNIQKRNAEISHAEKRSRPLPTGKYQVIYADPPWSYDNSGFDQSAASHYPTMKLEEICNLPIREMAAETTVLFMWATSPLLPEALEVIKAWGFEYKASMVWVKNHAPGIGWWVQTQHEMLLIASNDSNHPKIKPPSVMILDSDKHSKKPEEFYSIIESMYPEGNKIELFARNTRNGWEAWGNEIN